MFWPEVVSRSFEYQKLELLIKQGFHWYRGSLVLLLYILLFLGAKVPTCTIPLNDTYWYVCNIFLSNKSLRRAWPTDKNKSVMKCRQTCDKAAKKVYQLCGSKHKTCTTGQGQKATCYKASILKSIIPTITPEDDILPKIALLDKHLGNDDNKECRVCPFIDKKIKDKLATIQ